ncbi:MAG: Gfo/Idh/MocA family protein [Gammaproteobacteria bacterium]
MDKALPLRAAVIGVGYLGRFHAQKYAAIPGVDLVAVADPGQSAREAVARETGSRPVADWRELLGQVDVVSIATPTPFHHEVARAFLEHGTHVLVEKPITTTVDEARDLIEVSARHGRLLQVGHLERFNPAVLALDGLLTRPRFLESHRLAPFRARGTDVSVVLDLMIHDIDLVQHLVGQPIAEVSAVGTQVFSDDLDIANARITFADGCVANVTASRVSLKMERKLRLFQDDAYFSLDLQQKILTCIRKRPADDVPEGIALDGQGLPPVNIDEKTFEQGDALRMEIEAFLRSVREGLPAVVSGEDGLRALETATRIATLVRQGDSAA